MVNLVLLLGGNLGDRMKYLSDSKELIKKMIGSIIKESRIYETEPWGFNNENLFLNQILIVETDFNPHQVLQTIFEIENKLERTRQSIERYVSRTIDIDIIFYGDEVFDYNDLVVPHAQIQNRMFVLKPLNEILPNFLHPKLQKPIFNLMNNCTDKSIIKVYNFEG